jgi:outer membrane protein X
MKKTLHVLALLAFATTVSVPEVRAQFQSRVGLESWSSGDRGSSLRAYAALATLPTLVYARTHGMTSLVDELQDTQYIGAGLAYGSEIEKIGLQAMYMYFITSVIALGGDFTFFFPDTFDFGGIETKTNWMALNILGRYVIYQSALMHAYVLAGLNFTIFRVKVEGLGQSQSDSSSKLGLDLGGGLAYAIGFALLYAELSYVLGDADQLVLAAGLRFPLGGQH